VTTTTRRGVRTIGVVLVLGGAVLVLVAFGPLDWYDVPTRNAADATDDISFSALHSSAGQLGGTGLATAYFGWLAWLLLIGLIMTGVAANLPFGTVDPFRVAGFLCGALGATATYFAVTQLHNAQVAAGAEKHSVFYNSTWGLWAALVGFVIGAMGAALGARTTAGPA
jgi:hypothetical protein